MPVLEKPSAGSRVHVLITREPFMEFFTLTLDNGYSEELDVEETKLWFQDHGADMTIVDKALDHCWNFYRSEVNINHFRIPASRIVAHAPKL